jgi:GT2 family glycosyltransferase
MEPVLVSVLIITWNRKDDLLETIRSIYDQDYRNFEIVVVDNGSTDGTVEKLHQSYPEVKIVALSRNEGVSGGRNAGIAAAKGEIIFCLDSDAAPAKNTLLNLVRRFRSDPEVGIINCKIVNTNSKQLDGGPGWVYSERQKARQDSEFLSWSFSEGGAAIRREVFNRIGLFWDLLFFGGEGQEFGLRTWDVGYKILYYPASIVYHRASEQQRFSDKHRDYLFFRNTLYIYIVRYPWWMLALLGPLKIGAVMIRFGKRGYLPAAFKALLEVVRKLPVLLKERKPINNRTAWFYLKLLRQQGPLSWDIASWFKYKT